MRWDAMEVSARVAAQAVREAMAVMAAEVATMVAVMAVQEEREAPVAARVEQVEVDMGREAAVARAAAPSDVATFGISPPSRRRVARNHQGGFGSHACGR